MMIRKGILMVAFLVVAASAFAQTKDMWKEFAKTKFEPKYDEKIGEYIYHPSFTPDLKALLGKEVILEGFYVPFAPEDGDYIIISKFPMSQCFFCGVGGPESVAEVTLKDGSQKFQVDDLITVKGKLKLNTENPEHMNFLIIDAVLVKK
jgi:uncharacterized membrane protein YcgQ (UPF0703/DUF1980 family)